LLWVDDYDVVIMGVANILDQYGRRHPDPRAGDVTATNNTRRRATDRRSSGVVFEEEAGPRNESMARQAPR
jgi:hypothetical protein